MATCSSGASGGSGTGLRVIGFLEAGQDNIPRNRVLVFRFSEPVVPQQDFFERMKIRNLDTTPGATDFTRATGAYTCDADKVLFTPRLPNREDRADAGFRANGFYSVFLKSGPDALRSVSGALIETQQEFIFETNEYFEDPWPADPPRVFSLTAVDPSSGQTTDLSRLDPRPTELAKLGNHRLVAEGRVIDPGGGGPPGFPELWHLELLMSEPLDPATVTSDVIEMFEIYSDATDSADTDPVVTAPGDDNNPYYGNPVNFKVPIVVEMDQGLNAAGVTEVRIRVIPQILLVDDTRYRLSFSGTILGLDFRQTFIGENGLTGDGETPVDGETQPFPEPGGLGYVTEFIVRDRPTINAVRVLTYDPLVDGIQPEDGQTTLDPTVVNSALYNPPSAPGNAIGNAIGFSIEDVTRFNFGSGVDGDLAVSSGSTQVLDTGDTPNRFISNPFEVIDLDPADTYKNSNGLPPPGPIEFDSMEPTVFDFSSVTVSGSATLRIIGLNPCRILSAGLVQIDGTIDAAGGDGGNGTSKEGNPNNNQNLTTTPGYAGAGGPGGFPGGESSSPLSTKSGSSSGVCDNTGFDRYLNDSGVTKSGWPWSKKGEGPGRGNQGGEVYQLTQQRTHNQGGSYAGTGTGGGGGSHATSGTAGEDRINASSAIGTYGKCTTWGFPNSSLIGLRGMPGPVYGDREAVAVLMGGSGGGAGGAAHGWYNSGGGIATGGGGGGGGGFLEILSEAEINVGGVIDVSGGDGGQGAFQSLQSNTWTRVAGSGGGGAGGTISLIAADQISLSGGMLDARGGIGGARPSNTNFSSCGGCNGGGDGGKGFIFLLHGGAVIPGLTPGLPGEYDDHTNGVLTIRSFAASAVTELYSAGVADPVYLSMSSGDILALPYGNGQIKIWASSAKPNADDPLTPDLATEIAAIEVARVTASSGSANVTIVGDLRNLNPSGGPGRDAFVRMQADFAYDDLIDAALGPFMAMDEITVKFTFN